MNLGKSLGLDWRWSLYGEYWFYLRTCKNYKDLIQARRTGRPFGEIALRNGLVFETVGNPKFSLDVFRDIWHRGAYLKGFEGSPPRTVVDIGAHIGMFSMQAAILWPSARIFAYEPEPENYAVLNRNIKRNNLNNVVAFNKAISGEIGAIDFYVKEQAESHSIFDTSYGGRTRQVIRVSSVTLAQVFERVGEVIDFLKVDCEGCEYDLMSSSISVLQTNVRYMVMEYHQGKTGRPIADGIVTPLRCTGFVIQIEELPQEQIGLITAINQELRRV